MVMYTCKHCGKPVQKLRNNHQYKYCSYSCYYNARYGEIIPGELNSMRNPLCLQAVRLCQAGLTQVEAAKRVGIELHILATWFHRHGAVNIATLFAGRICQYCGKSLEGMSSLSNRKYCSSVCREGARYTEKPLSEGQRMKSNPELRMEALELYWGGLDQRAIAQHFGIPEGTVCSWVHDYGGERERMKTNAATRLMPARQRLREAKTADEWLRGLQELAAPSAMASECPPIHLVCKVIHGQSEVNQLVAIISEHLGLNPLSGEVFAFCNKGHTEVTTITWKGSMYTIVGLPRMYGRYLWPHENMGQSITVTAHEFEYLISCYKRSYERQKAFKIH